MPEIPYRIDWFSVFMLLGVVQGFFISYFFFKNKSLLPAHQKYLGWLVFGFSLTILEIFLCYSGYIVHVIHFYDLSEPVNFIIGPLLFLISASIADKLPKKVWIHFIPFGLYCLYCCLFIFQSGLYKFNAFLWAYHPEIEQLEVAAFWPEDPLRIKDYVNELALLHCGLYLPFITMNLIPWPRGKKHGWILGVFIILVLNYILWFYKTFFLTRDLFDNVIASLDTLLIYFVSFHLLKQSSLFQAERSVNKYAKSSLPESYKDNILRQLNQSMEVDKLFLNPDLSLKSLAAELNVSTHHLSQVLNEKLQKRFYDYLNTYRIAEAKRLLTHPEFQDYKLQEIARQAGFKSKSAFNNSFKKQTGMTPSDFRK